MSKAELITILQNAIQSGDTNLIKQCMGALLRLSLKGN